VQHTLLPRGKPRGVAEIPPAGEQRALGFALLDRGLVDARYSEQERSGEQNPDQENVIATPQGRRLGSLTRRCRCRSFAGYDFDHLQILFDRSACVQRGARMLARNKAEVVEVSGLRGA